MKPKPEAWRAGLTDDEVAALSAEDRAMLLAAAELDVENRDGEFGELPYNPVYDPNGRMIT